MLTTLDYLPAGLLDRTAPQLHEILTGPTLIHLPGKHNPPLFVSVLLHGNEDTGWLAVRQLLQEQISTGLPRALSLLIGNVAAARYGRRHLDEQPDYNRIWLKGSRPEHGMAAAVIEQMRQRGVFASLDIHNNTGLNPHYACLNRLDPPFLQLATLFGSIVLYFTRPAGTQSAAFGEFCPAVVLECGKPDQPHGVSHAWQYLQDCLRLSHIPDRPVAPQDLNLFHTVATVRVPDSIRFDFADPDPAQPKAMDPTCHVLFPPHLDHLNFQELSAQTVIAHLGHPTVKLPLQVIDETGEEVGERYFQIVNNQIVTRTPVMPSMLTLNATIIQQDCLCYLMERYSPPSLSA
ncbi:MAG: M14 family metallopeptidase [Cyanobacteriota bacterium]|nr:M14 family metallopeptidase [Cyanobacteriota bacterium]